MQRMRQGRVAKTGRWRWRTLPSVRSMVLTAAGVAAAALAIGLVLTARLGGAVDWSPHILTALPALPLLGIGSYGFRFLRWHLLVRRRAPHVALRDSVRIYMTGFSLGLTPGRVGEFLKFALLRQVTGVPEVQTVAVLPIEAATEAVSFLLVALTGAVIGGYRLPDAGLGVVLAGVALALLALLGPGRSLVRARRWGKPMTTGLPALQSFLYGLLAVGGPSSLIRALACALGARLCEILLFFLAVRMAGEALPPAAAMLVWGTSGLVGGLSLLPGGVGAVEGTIVATAVAVGATAPAALAAALLSRTLTLWVWIPFGLVFAVRTYGQGRGTVAPDDMPTGAIGLISASGNYPARSKASEARSAISRPIASEDVAAGDGALRT